MQTLIRPPLLFGKITQEIAALCKETGEPVFLTKNGEGDLVVMDIATYDQREKQLELREKLIEIEELRRAGAPDMDARGASANLRTALKGKLMYKVDISPSANAVLEGYTFRCARDNGEECALRLLDAYDEKISYWNPLPSSDVPD